MRARYHRWVLSELLVVRRDTSWSVLVVSFLGCGAHMISTRYFFTHGVMSVDGAHRVNRETFTHLEGHLRGRTSMFLWPGEQK